MTRHYGEREVWKFARIGNELVCVPADSQYAVEFFSDVPHHPAYAPATEPEVAKAEKAIGRRLPELLRRIYLEVANGGFGPDWSGLLSLTDGQDTPRWDGPSAVEMSLTQREWGLPDAWFALAHGGCSMYWYVVLDRPGNPVHYYDWDGWDFPPGTPNIPPELVQPIEVGIAETTPTLADWLWHWVEGGRIRRRDGDGLSSGA